MRKVIAQIILLLSSFTSYAQMKSNVPDTAINNLVHTPGYKTSELGAIPKFVKAGKGKQTLLLIPGLGFDASVFKDFMEANKNNYTMYAVTIPGFGKTPAPPMPPAGTSYGEQSWNKGAVEGIAKLIDKEKLSKPVIVGHFVQGIQLAVMLATSYPEKVGRLILMGGPAKFIAVMNGKIIDNPKEKMIMATDKYTGPKWFMHMEKKDYDAGNFLPEIYSLDSTAGKFLWKKSAEVIMPVAVRYSSEYFASDVRADFDKIKCPVLVLRNLFDSTVLDATINIYLKPQFIDSWDDASTRNPLITVKDIKDAACFVWKDKPAETYSAIKDFLRKEELKIK